MSKIGYKPYGKNILVEVPKEDTAFVSTNLISLDTVSDAELLQLGGNTKAALAANKSSEEQVLYKVVEIGNKVDKEEVNIGDMVYVKPAVQAVTIELKGKYYYEFEEFWLLGKMIN